MRKTTTAFEQNVLLLAKRLDEGYPLTPGLKDAISELVCAAAESARREREHFESVAQEDS